MTLVNLVRVDTRRPSCRRGIYHLLYGIAILRQHKLDGIDIFSIIAAIAINDNKTHF